MLMKKKVMRTEEQSGDSRVLEAVLCLSVLTKTLVLVPSRERNR